MARKSRMLLQGFPCHIIQRGNNRQACFRSVWRRYVQHFNYHYKRSGTLWEGRCLAYRDLFKDSIDRKTDRWFTDKLNKEFPIGGDRFKTEIEEALGVKYKRGKVGRPRLVNCL